MTVVPYLLGALTAIVTGNVIAIIVAVAGRRLAAPTWHRVLGLALGVLGLATFLVLSRALLTSRTDTKEALT